MKNHSVAVVIPCLNEEIAIKKVITDFQKTLPNAEIWIFDNGSTDQTVEISKSLGAKVRAVPLKGKGYALIQSFADIEADYILTVDGDDTYEAEAAPELLALATIQNLDMVTGIRKTQNEKQAYRLGHVLGNKMLTGLVQKFFPGQSPNDMLSGYRVFSKRFYKSFAYIISGFEIETYLTVHALNLAMPTGELETKYKERPQGSSSKLRTYHDGFRILFAISGLILRERPYFAFGWLSFLIALLGTGLGLSLLPEYFETHTVSRFPTAILSAALVLFALIVNVCGILLHFLSCARQEQRRLKYLDFSPISKI